MIDRLYHWQSVGFSRVIDVHLPFESELEVPVVYWNFFERDYLDTLQLMHGKRVEMMAMWDWFDITWDKVHDRKLNYTREECFSNICSTHPDLARLTDKFDHYAVEHRKRHAIQAYAWRNDPPITFTGVFL